MRISDWSSDVCSSDLGIARPRRRPHRRRAGRPVPCSGRAVGRRIDILSPISIRHALRGQRAARGQTASIFRYAADRGAGERITVFESLAFLAILILGVMLADTRSEERRVGKGGVSTYRY